MDMKMITLYDIDLLVRTAEACVISMANLLEVDTFPTEYTDSVLQHCAVELQATFPEVANDALAIAENIRIWESRGTLSAMQADITLHRLEMSRLELLDSLPELYAELSEAEEEAQRWLVTEDDEQGTPLLHQWHPVQWFSPNLHMHDMLRHNLSICMAYSDLRAEYDLINRLLQNYYSGDYGHLREIFCVIVEHERRKQAAVNA